MFKLVIDGGLGWTLGLRPLLIGRGPSNDVLLEDDAVSSQHAAVWMENGVVWVRDLQSRNGVTINDVPVQGAGKAQVGDFVRIGTTRLRVEAGPGRGPDAGALVLEHLGSHHRTAFPGERLRLGDAPDVDVTVTGVTDAVLLRVGPDEVLLGFEDDTVPVVVGQPFTLGGQPLVLLHARGDVRETRELSSPISRFVLEATLEDGPGPRAWVRDEAHGKTLEIVAENRAALLWLLGKKILDDRAGAVPEDRAAWVSEHEAMTSVWGRASGATPANLRVLVCRVRKELREAGLDPWLIEHRSGHLRARFATVVLR